MWGHGAVMILQKIYRHKKPLIFLLTLLIYLFFFYPVLSKDTLIYSGNDSEDYHYPSRGYLYEKLKMGEFPFWTERIYGGYPIFKSLERGYQNPINIILIYLLGPYTSYKVLHLLAYLLGSLGIYGILKANKIYTLKGYLISVLGYYFTFFHIQQQQHFNFIITTYSIPLLLYLIHLLLNRPKFIYFILLNILILFLFYLGSFQALLIALSASLIYVISFLPSQFKKSLRLLFINFLLFAILSLPGLYSTYDLYKTSIRYDSEGIFNQGSVTPLMHLTMAVPYLFGRNDNFNGVLIHREYTHHEIYFYAGITLLLITILTLTYSEHKNVKKFLIVNWILFLILSTVRFIPLLNSYLPPPYSIFRYWYRYQVVFQLAIVLCVASFFKQKSVNIKFLKVLKSLIIIALPYFILEVLNVNNPRNIAFYNIFRRNDFNLDQVNILVFTIGSVFITLFLLFLLKKISMRFFVNGVFLISLFDILLLGKIGIAGNFKNINEFDNWTSDNLRNVRVYDVTKAISSNDCLYVGCWSILGYEPLVPKSTSDLLQSYSITNTRHGKYPEINGRASIVETAKKLGIESLRTYEGYYVLDTSYPFRYRYKGIDNVFMTEGSLNFSKTSDDTVFIQTFIKDDENWILEVNGKNTKWLSNKNGFITFNLDTGNTHARLYYNDKNYFYLLGASITLYLVLILVLKKKYNFVR